MYVTEYQISKIEDEATEARPSFLEELIAQLKKPEDKVRVVRRPRIIPLRPSFQCPECGCKATKKQHGFTECEWCKGYGRRIKM